MVYGVICSETFEDVSICWAGGVQTKPQNFFLSMSCPRSPARPARGLSPTVVFNWTFAHLMGVSKSLVELEWIDILFKNHPTYQPSVNYQLPTTAGDWYSGNIFFVGRGQ